MRRRYLEHAAKVVIADAAQEMNPRRVQPFAEFAQHLLAVGLAIGRRASVARAIGADHHDLGARSSGLYQGRRPHERDESAIGLEVACDVGDDLVACLEFEPRGQ